MISERSAEYLGEKYKRNPLRVTDRWFFHMISRSYLSFFLKKIDHSCKFDKSEKSHDTVNTRKQCKNEKV
jgi:hypothetical protein